MIIRDVTLRFPAIYKPATFQTLVKYGVAFECGEEDAQRLSLQDIYSKERYGERLFNANSKFPPMIYCQDYEILMSVMQQCDVRNISKDKLFNNLKADLSVHVFDYETPERAGRGLGLTALMVDVRELASALNALKMEE